MEHVGDVGWAQIMGDPGSPVKEMQLFHRHQGDPDHALMCVMTNLVRWRARDRGPKQADWATLSHVPQRHKMRS